MIIRRSFGSVLAIACGIGACTGTETGNPPVIDFGNSGCHDQRYDKGLQLQSLDQPALDPLYKGLTCMTWQHVDTRTVRIGLTNYEAGCHSDEGWQPRAQLRADGGLDLIIQDDECSTAACGWCIYDLSFTVELDAPLADGEVRVYQQGCGEGPMQPKRATLALASRPSGAVCNYAHESALFWRNGDPGGVRTPCTIGDDKAACQATLECTDLGSRPAGDFSGGTRCLATCASDADCDSLSRCEGDVCRLSATGLTSN